MIPPGARCGVDEVVEAGEEATELLEYPLEIPCSPEPDPYDPRKQEYLRPATEAEVLHQHMQMTEAQMHKLQRAVASRAKFVAEEAGRKPDIRRDRRRLAVPRLKAEQAVLDNYRRILAELSHDILDAKEALACLQECATGAAGATVTAIHWSECCPGSPYRPCLDIEENAPDVDIDEDDEDISPLRKECESPSKAFAGRPARRREYRSVSAESVSPRRLPRPRRSADWVYDLCEDTPLAFEKGSTPRFFPLDDRPPFFPRMEDCEEAAPSVMAASEEKTRRASSELKPQTSLVLPGSSSCVSVNECFHALMLMKSRKRDVPTLRAKEGEKADEWKLVKATDEVEAEPEPQPVEIVATKSEV